MNTESRNSRSFGLDKMSAQEIARLMNEEDHTVLAAMRAVEQSIALAAEKIAETYNRGGRTFYIGAGTSGRIAVADAAEMPPTFGIESDRFIAIQAGGQGAVRQSVEDAEDDEHSAITALNNANANRNDIVIGLSASGWTPFVLAAIRHASQKGIWTCGIANATQSPIIEEATLGILLDTGPEILTGSTRLKAGTSQKLALNQISTAAMVLCGKVIENLMVDLVPKNTKLKERCVRIVRDLTTATEDEARECLLKNNWDIRAVLAQIRQTAVSF